MKRVIDIPMNQIKEEEKKILNLFWKKKPWHKWFWTNNKDIKIR